MRATLPANNKDTMKNELKNTLRSLAGRVANLADTFPNEDDAAATPTFQAFRLGQLMGQLDAMRDFIVNSEAKLRNP